MFKPGDIVLIPFPHSDLSSSKRRPVLVVTKPDRHGDFVCLAITSVSQSEAAIFIQPVDLQEGSLPKPSWIRTEKVFTLSQDIVVRKFGSLGGLVWDRVRSEMCTAIGCK